MNVRNSNLGRRLFNAITSELLSPTGVGDGQLTQGELDAAEAVLRIDDTFDPADASLMSRTLGKAEMSESTRAQFEQLISAANKLRVHDLAALAGIVQVSRDEFGQLTLRTLVLDLPIVVDGASFASVQLPRSFSVAPGSHVELHGELDPIGIVGEGEPPNGLQLTGIANLSAGEPRFDGLHFWDGANHELKQLWYRPCDGSGEPNKVFVLEPGTRTAFIATHGGHLPEFANPYSGILEARQMTSPTKTDRRLIQLTPEGAINTQTKKKLEPLGEESGKPWYYDVDAGVAYRFESPTGPMGQVIRPDASS